MQLPNWASRLGSRWSHTCQQLDRAHLQQRGHKKKKGRMILVFLLMLCVINNYLGNNGLMLSMVTCQVNPLSQFVNWKENTGFPQIYNTTEKFINYITEKKKPSPQRKTWINLQNDRTYLYVNQNLLKVPNTLTYPKWTIGFLREERNLQGTRLGGVGKVT